MQGQETVAVIGAGVIGASVAYALARTGRTVVLIDRLPPGEGGASFGNAGHIATELVEPLPSTPLLFGFWRQRFAVGGVLDIPARRLAQFAPWALRFASAAFRRRTNTGHLAPFVRPAVSALTGLLTDAGRPDLIRQHGHYEIWLGGKVHELARRQAEAMEKLEVLTQPAPRDLVDQVRVAARAEIATGLWFPKCAHVLDPLEVVRAFVTAAGRHGATFLQRKVCALRARGTGFEIVTDAEPVLAGSAVVCLGAWSAPLLEPFGFRVPLEAARGYHVQMPHATPLIDAPILYCNENILVTPMTGRVRATSFMEFAGIDAPPDPRKPAWLRAKVSALGYACDPATPSWIGPRPVLPDYLPALGRAAHPPNLLYAFGHQHIGLTLAGVTAQAVTDLVVGRPRPDLAAFDLRRF
jgi:glycine/D-amino acid oxidase-like deaminating enzyme